MGPRNRNTIGVALHISWSKIQIRNKKIKVLNKQEAIVALRKIIIMAPYIKKVQFSPIPKFFMGNFKNV